MTYNVFGGTLSLTQSINLGSWSYTKINVPHRELNPDTVTHLSTNRAWRWLTSLFEADALTTMPDHHQNVVTLVSCAQQ